jgi:uncharacterized protein YrrD
MMRATELRDRAVVDLGSGAKIGRVDELILDPGRRRVSGVIVTSRRGLLGRGPRRTIPAAALHALGEDALTVRLAEATDVAIEEVAGLPVLGQVVGRKVLTRGGRLLGSIADVLIQPPDGWILGYALAGRDRSGLSARLGDGRSGGLHIRADADLLVGRDMIIVPDDAAVEGEPDAEQPPGPPRAAAPAEPLVFGRVGRPAPASNPDGASVDRLDGRRDGATLGMDAERADGTGSRPG